MYFIEFKHHWKRGFSEYRSAPIASRLTTSEFTTCSAPKNDRRIGIQNWGAANDVKSLLVSTLAKSEWWIRYLCWVGPHTGCRPSELIEISPARVDLSGSTVTLRSLKKRKDRAGRPRIVYRAVPVPPEYLDTLNTAHGIREAQRTPKKAKAPIWPLSRVRVWQIVKGVMTEAGLPDAPHRSPKGLRHGFGINATVKGVPLHMLSKWMGHAQLSTTVIYANAVGKEVITHPLALGADA